MKNEYRIEGKDVFIKLKNGMEFVIDIDDLPHVSKFSWYPLKHTENYTSVQGSSSIKVNGLKKSTSFRLHRYILGMTDSSKLVDHIDRNQLNNRRNNLRICNRKESAWNTGLFKSNVSSKFKGVTFNKARKKWIAQIHTEGKTRGLGYFISEKDAANAYNSAVLLHRNEFAFINTIE